MRFYKEPPRTGPQDVEAKGSIADRENGDGGIEVDEPEPEHRRRPVRLAG